ncbi:MAG: pseudouridine synthase [bacterium]
MVRLNKFLAFSGVASRRKCDTLIADGQVKVNGAVENRLGVKIDARTDRVEVNGRELNRHVRFEYVLLNKPKGVVTTASDEKGRKTVLDLIDSSTRLFPVGRLDRDSNGLLLLTNDGELTYRLTHPKFEVGKVYEVFLEPALHPDDKSKIESGVELEEGKTGRCRIVFPNMKNKSLLHIRLRQGWKRQVRRMFAAYGYDVILLKRIAMGPLQLQGLKTGEWRKLTRKEILNLKTRVEL